MAKIKITFINGIQTTIEDATEKQFDEICDFMNNPKNRKYKCFTFEAKNNSILYNKEMIMTIMFDKEDK